MNNEEKMMNSVPMGQKIAFGLGMLANQLFPALLSIFIVVLIQDLGFSPLLYGIIAFIPRFIDAITDPLMGFISDNTKSKWGKRRQYVFFGGILTGIAFHFILATCMQRMGKLLISGTSCSLTFFFILA